MTQEVRTELLRDSVEYWIKSYEDLQRKHQQLIQFHEIICGYLISHMIKQGQLINRNDITDDQWKVIRQEIENGNLVISVGNNLEACWRHLTDIKHFIEFIANQNANLETKI